MFSTIYDIWMEKRERKPCNTLTIFSLNSNFRDLMKINESNSIINCIDGIKVLSAIWIIIGHRRDMMMSLFHKRSHQNVVLWDEAAVGIVNNYFYCVVTFLTCSGILVAQSFLRSFERYKSSTWLAFAVFNKIIFFSGKFNIFKIILNRYLRFLPSVGILVMYFKSSLPRLTTDGPLFGQLQQKIDNCKASWWVNLLFLQNFMSLGKPVRSLKITLTFDSWNFLLVVSQPYVVPRRWSSTIYHDAILGLSFVALRSKVS
jgi:hypothetical protein